MKLSTETLIILKNFAGINSNLVIKPGSSLSTIAEAKNILATAEISETFDTEIGIYDLNEFLNVLGLFTNCELSFKDKRVDIEEDGGQCLCTYHYADPSILTTPSQSITMPETDVTVDLSEAVLSQARKAAATMGHTIMSIVGNEGVVSLVIKDPKNTSSNTFSIIVDKDNANKYKFDLQFLISNLKVLSGDYTVEISKKLISKWSLKSQPLEYFIAMEKTSNYGE